MCDICDAFREQRHPSLKKSKIIKTCEGISKNGYIERCAKAGYEYYITSGTYKVNAVLCGSHLVDIKEEHRNWTLV